MRVAGVAGDVLSAGLDRPTTPTIYRQYSRYARAEFRVVVRTAVSDRVRESNKPCIPAYLAHSAQNPNRSELFEDIGIPQQNALKACRRL